MAAPKIKLNNGLEIPALGLGTYLAGENFHQAVWDAVDAGYRHFDTAFCYENEAELGNALNQKIKEGVIKREDLFITTKLWNNAHLPESAVKMCRKSNDNLGLGYIDLFLVHSPIAVKEGDELDPLDADGQIECTDTDYLDTWKGMEKCVELGLTKSIGVSNFNSEQIDRLLSSAKIKPVCNQVECSPIINQKKLIKFCEERDIVIVGHTPFSRPDWQQEGKPKNAMENEGVIKIAEKYNKEPSQVILRYLYENDVVLIPKSVSKSRIESNINIFDFKLSEEDHKLLDTFNCNYRVYPYDDSLHSIYYPFNIEF